MKMSFSRFSFFVSRLGVSILLLFSSITSFAQAQQPVQMADAMQQRENLYCSCCMPYHFNWTFFVCILFR
jgi:flagellar biosynthesis/type III secretory pathway ATPase